MLARHGHRRSPRPEHRYLAISKSAHRAVRDYVEAHLDDNLLLTVLADIACLSPYHFSRSF